MYIMKWMTRPLRRRWHRFRRRGWSSRSYVYGMIHTNMSAMMFPNAVYGWLIMCGMLDTVERRPTHTGHVGAADVPWQVHPRNVMHEGMADQFLGAFEVIQRIDRTLMRNVARYARAIGAYYIGSTLTAEEVLAVVNAIKDTETSD